MSLLFLLVAFVLALFVGASEPRAGKLPAHCEPIVVGQMYVCPPRGHAFARGARGRWHDIGLLTPEPILVPTLPER